MRHQPVRQEYPYTQLKKRTHCHGVGGQDFEMDHYTVKEELIPKVKDRLDWEHPESIDWDRLVKQVKKASATIVLVEGIFAFDPRIASLYSKKVLIEIDQATFMQRRKSEIRWGVEPLWYLEHVWVTNQKLVRAATPDIELKFDGTDNLQKVMNLITTDTSFKNRTNGTISG